MTKNDIDLALKARNSDQLAAWCLELLAMAEDLTRALRVTTLQRDLNRELVHTPQWITEKKTIQREKLKKGWAR